MKPFARINLSSAALRRGILVSSPVQEERPQRKEWQYEKALVGAWLCRRLDDGTIVRRRITKTEAYCGEEDTSAPRIGIAYASKRDQNRKWRWTLCK